MLAFSASAARYAIARTGRQWETWRKKQTGKSVCFFCDRNVSRRLVPKAGIVRRERSERRNSEERAHESPAQRRAFIFRTVTILGTAKVCQNGKKRTGEVPRRGFRLREKKMQRKLLR